MDAKTLFEILMREHAEMLTVYLRAVVRDATLADDLFQETMLTAWRRLDDFDRSRPFGPWLRGIAGKFVMSHRRKQSRGAILCDEATLEVIDHRLHAVNHQPGDTLDEKLAILDDCIEALPEHYRVAIRSRYGDALTLEKLASNLEIAVETLKKRLQRARARLLDCMTRKLAVAESVS